MAAFFIENQWLLWIIIGVPTLLLLWYIIGTWASGAAVLISKKSAPSLDPVKADSGEQKGENKPQQGPEQADLLYYLPTASLQVKATATVVISRNPTDNKVVATRLAALQLENTVVMQPDTSQLFMANYTSSIFSNDELHLTATPQGLLENVSSTTEDRITNIIGQLMEAPKKIVSRDIAGPEELQEEEEEEELEIPANAVDEVATFTNTFTILSSELHAPPFERIWIINIPGVDASKKKVDASVQFSLPRVELYKVAAGKEFNGLVTRAQRSATLEVKTKMKNRTFSWKPILKYDILIPDHSRLVVVPIKRASFVKNQYTPKFNAGMLIENSIIKPSEAEGFVSIPINILKSIFALPSQLLSFKITHLKQLSELEAAQQKLKEQQAVITRPSPPEKPGPAPAKERPQEGPSSPSVTDLLRDLTSRLKDTQPVNQFPAPNVLGKLPVKASAVQKEVVDAELNVLSAAVGGPFQPPPPEKFWHTNVKVAWNSYINEQVPDCVPAAAAHLIMSWSATTFGQPKVPSLDDVLGAYYIVGELGKGCDITKFLKHWKSLGLGMDMITDSVKMKEKEIEKVKYAVNYFGGCLAGLLMPLTAKGSNEWLRPKELTGDGAPGSWCPHAVPILGYDGKQLYAISLGALVTMSWDFYTTYNDESHVILSKTNWIKADNRSTEGTAFNTLRSGLRSFNA
jgi:hypothetical protein